MGTVNYQLTFWVYLQSCTFVVGPSHLFQPSSLTVSALAAIHNALTCTICFVLICLVSYCRVFCFSLPPSLPPPPHPPLPPSCLPPLPPSPSSLSSLPPSLLFSHPSSPSSSPSLPPLSLLPSLPPFSLLPVLLSHSFSILICFSRLLSLSIYLSLPLVFTPCPLDQIQFIFAILSTGSQLWTPVKPYQ